MTRGKPLKLTDFSAKEASKLGLSKPAIQPKPVANNPELMVLSTGADLATANRKPPAASPQNSAGKKTKAESDSPNTKSVNVTRDVKPEASAHGSGKMPLSSPQPRGVDVAMKAMVALPEFVAALESWDMNNAITWEGVWPNAAAPLIAASQIAKPRTAVVIVPQPVDIDTIVRDLDYLLERTCEIFPQASDDAEIESLLQQEVVQRLQVLSKLESQLNQSAKQKSVVKESPPALVVTTLPALMHAVPSPDSIRSSRRVIKQGTVENLADLRAWLAAAGYLTTTSVQLPGEFTVRGGILDVFPPDLPEPIRIEWFDNEVESIRMFDAVTQKSIDRMETIALPKAKGNETTESSLLDYLPDDAVVYLYEPISIQHVAKAFLDRIPFPDRFQPVDRVMAAINDHRHASLMQLADQGYLGAIHRCLFNDVSRITGELEQLPAIIDQAVDQERHATVLCWNDGELSRMRELLAGSKSLADQRTKLEIGSLAAGFEIGTAGPMILSVNQMLKRHTLRRGARKIASRALDSFLDLREGDLVVHLSHGIGIYRGLQMIEKLGQKHEHLEIEFAEGTKLFVPTSKIDLIQRYIGGTKATPKLAKIGGQAWVRQKKAAEEAVTDMAAELLDMQAQRRSRSGIAFSPDTVWQNQFDASFPYIETPDQMTAINALKKDMVSSRPMDRLICGDVGFGKTEVAMRAAFKAIDSGYQVAVLVPTTVLAEQHYKTFCERMAEFPFDVAKLSRFCTGKEQKETLAKLAKGQVDLVIGTHRLASEDVDFFNLGLVIIDEEQRFGVAVKERLKQQRPNVDLLTLSATPIPRTLHMSLVGVRDISNLETAPEERLSIETRVVRFDDAIIRNAIMRELNRGGQIYFVHNRIQDMGALAARLQRLVPDARIIIGHGQMPEHQLEQVMIDFIDHRYDILLATTIIESGLDIPNANTIFIDAADRYGLSELHQLRGRVGRYKHQAYCYLLVDRNKHLNPDAARRMHAIEEYSQIGAGFGIAMRDLEIRGAGNLLGTQQSGHIAAIGYELYCQLLESAVRKIKHQKPKLSIDVEINLAIEGFLPAEYVPEIRHKIDLYRRLTRMDDIRKLQELRQELEDRFGNPPREVEKLLEVAELRIDAALWSIKCISTEDDFMVFTYTDRNRIEQLARLHRGHLRVLDQQKAYWPIEGQTNQLLEIAQMVLRNSKS
jgi:transcription-repair coupling factor (superfamily II helicase)